MGKGGQRETKEESKRETAKGSLDMQKSISYIIILIPVPLDRYSYNLETYIFQCIKEKSPFISLHLFSSIYVNFGNYFHK